MFGGTSVRGQGKETEMLVPGDRSTWGDVPGGMVPER